MSPGTAGRPHSPSDQGLSRPGPLVDSVGPRTMPVSPGTAGQIRGPSHMGPIHPGQLVDRLWDQSLSVWGNLVEPTGPSARAQARVDCDSWMTQRALLHGPEWPRAAVRPHRHSDPSTRRPGQLVDTAGLGPEPEWPGRAGQTHRNSGTGLSRPGELVNPAVPRSRARVAQVSWSNRVPLVTCTSCPGQLVDPGGTSHKGPSLSRPGHLDDPAGPRTLAQGAQDSWTTTQAVEPVPKTPSRTGRSRGLSYPIACHPGQLVEPTGTTTRPESPRRAGRHRGPSDPGWGHPGQLVDPTGPRARAQVQVDRDSWTNLRALGHGPESLGAAGRH